MKTFRELSLIICFLILFFTNANSKAENRVNT